MCRSLQPSIGTCAPRGGFVRREPVHSLPRLWRKPYVSNVAKFGEADSGIATSYLPSPCKAEHRRPWSPQGSHPYGVRESGSRKAREQPSYARGIDEQYCWQLPEKGARQCASLVEITKTVHERLTPALR